MTPFASRSSALARSTVKTVGFLVDWLDGVYQNELLDGVRDAARDRRVQLFASPAVFYKALRAAACTGTQPSISPMPRTLTA